MYGQFAEGFADDAIIAKIGFLVVPAVEQSTALSRYHRSWVVTRMLEKH